MIKKNIQWILVTLLLLIVMGISAGLYWYTQNQSFKSDNLPVTQPSVRVDFTEADLYEEMKQTFTQNEILGGFIFITSALKDNTNGGLWDSFVLDVATGAINKIAHEDPTYFLNKNDRNGKYIYAGRPWKTDSEPGIYNDSILVTDFESTQTMAISENPKGDFYTRLRLPRWSPDGKSYVYSAQQWFSEKTKPEVGNIRSWKISVGTETATSTSFASGYGAVWAGKGDHIVYVKSDGIYSKAYIPGANHVKVPEYKVISEFTILTDQESYTPRNQIAMSPNGNYLAVQHLFVSPERSNGSVEIYKLMFEDEKPKATLVKRIALESGDGFFWPQFSPEGRYLSFQTSNFKKDVEEQNYIKVYDLFTEKYVDEIDFSAYKFDSSFNTDWVATKTF